MSAELPKCIPETRANPRVLHGKFVFCLSDFFYLSFVLSIGCDFSGNACHDIEVGPTARAQQDGHFCLCWYAPLKTDYDNYNRLVHYH